MSQFRSVALLIETSNEYARGLLRGILRYQQEHDRWSIDLSEQHRGAAPPAWLSRFRGNGIIARIETDEIAAAVRATGLPVVDVSAARHIPDVPWIETDDRGVAELAIDHLVSRGFSSVAFCGEAPFNWSRWRRDAFVKLAKQAELNVYTLDLSVIQEWTDDGWRRHRSQVLEWLKTLPEPCGVMAAYDSLARRILELCNEIGRAVPDSLAVLGVDNDPLLCQLSSPALTSIIPDAEGAGYLAAELLEQMMDGVEIDSQGRFLPPLGIATRRSTDTVAVEDPEVEAAARYILANACDGIQVHDVVERTALTRRVLELRFKNLLGSTPHELITNTRITRAKHLLRDSALSIDEIAQRCGYEYSEYLSRVFKKITGTTPAEFRRRFDT